MICSACQTQSRQSNNIKISACLTFEGRMLDISNAVHARHFSGLTMFVSAGNPKKPIGGPTGWPGIPQEQLRHLWRSCLRDYLCPDLTFVYHLQEVSGKIKLAIVRVVKSKISISEGFSWSPCVVRWSEACSVVFQWRTDTYIVSDSGGLVLYHNSIIFL
jgi:hypothetical protein